MSQATCQRFLDTGSLEINDWSAKTVHMIGVGGAGMSGAARMLLDLGANITGSDRTPFEGMGSLVRSGAQISIGHSGAWLGPRTDAVVVSAAIPESNPELVEARSLGLRVIKYAELLGLLMVPRVGIGIAGTHGKSTTSALTAYLFREAGLDPSYVIGARSDQLAGNCALGSGRHFIVESCEFDRSFLQLAPDLAVILNIEADHLDCYRDLEDIVNAFKAFARRIPAGGYLVYDVGDVNAMEAASSAICDVETFGINIDADWRAVNVVIERDRFLFDVLYHDSEIMKAELTLACEHNIGNAIAAIALAYRAGAKPQALSAALPKFEGIQRRMTLRGLSDDMTLIDDYAHHPTEVRATLSATRQRYKPDRLLVVFQPHQFARTWNFMDDFANAFDGADEVIVPDIYGARGGDHQNQQNGAKELANRISQHGIAARYVPDLADVADEVAKRATKGDVILTMGAGDVWKLTDALVQRLF